MAEQVLDGVRDAVEAPIDFEGQHLAEQINTYLLTAVGLLSFIIGYLTQNIYYTLWSGLGGTLLAFIVIVPPWPFYNNNPLKWLPVKRTDYSAINITVDPAKVQ